MNNTPLSLNISGNTNKLFELNGISNLVMQIINIKRGQEMKNFTLSFLLLLLLLTTGFLHAGSPSGSVSAAQKDVIVKSLLNGIASGNMGLMVSSAQFLAEYKSVRSVIPLMEMLHEAENEESRIAAALALIKIGDSRGVFAVRQAAHFDDSEHVRNMCMKFYCAYLCGKTDQ